jgi:ketosteroid isomerase-like protein
MKRSFFLSGLFILSSILSNGQSNDEQAIRQMLPQLATAFKNVDVSTLDRMYADDYIFISPWGVKYTKAERLDNIKSTPAPETFSYENPQIRIYDNTAVVNSEVKIKRKDEDLQTHLSTMVLHKNNGQWQVVNGQGTKKAGNP